MSTEDWYVHIKNKFPKISHHDVSLEPSGTNGSRLFLFCFFFVLFFNSFFFFFFFAFLKLIASCILSLLRWIASYDCVVTGAIPIRFPVQFTDPHVNRESVHQ